MDTEQLPINVHAPDQPVNIEFESGRAMRVKAVPELKEAEQVFPHEIPAGEEVTVPEPLPDLAMERV